MAVNFEDIMKLPTSTKWGILAGIIVVIVLCVGYLVIYPQIEAKTEKQEKYDNLSQELNEKKHVIAKLEKLEEELEAKKKQLEVLKKLLPDKKEIPQLLTGISSDGKESGLEFSFFRPKPEMARDFYAEIPMEIQVHGTYHQVATFFSKVGNMDRIVNITNVIMDNPRDEGETMILTTSCLATTFRFIETPVQKKNK